MKKFFLFLLFPFVLFSQDLYKSKSGSIFKVGEVIELGQATLISSSPLLATNVEWVTIFSEDGEEIHNMKFANKKGRITKIDTVGTVKIYFKLYNKICYANIEEALRKGEVVTEYNKMESSDKYDNLKKLKELLDMEAITKEEYEVEKKKILGF